MDRDLENLDAEVVRPTQQVEDGEGSFLVAPPSSLASTQKKNAREEPVSFFSQSWRCWANGTVRLKLRKRKPKKL